jgi:hypothetical protein
MCGRPPGGTVRHLPILRTYFCRRYCRPMPLWRPGPYRYSGHTFSPGPLLHSLWIRPVLPIVRTYLARPLAAALIPGRATDIPDILSLGASTTRTTCCSVHADCADMVLSPCCLPISRTYFPHTGNPSITINRTYFLLIPCPSRWSGHTSYDLSVHHDKPDILRAVSPSITIVRTYFDLSICSCRWTGHTLPGAGFSDRPDSSDSSTIGTVCP